MVTASSGSRSVRNGKRGMTWRGHINTPLLSIHKKQTSQDSLAYELKESEMFNEIKDEYRSATSERKRREIGKK